MKEALFAGSQYLLPQKAISRAMGALAETQITAIKNPFINWFIKKYQVDLSEAEITQPEAFKCFNDFFTRALKADARPIDTGPGALACPADGAISELGAIHKGQIYQAKNHYYTTQELLGGDPALARQFDNGQFVTVYLSPKDYHRVHMPVAGELQQMIHIPGDLFSVNQATANNVPRLFARNERVVCLFATEFGPMAMVLVGAMIVASIETTWAGLVTPQKRQIQRWNYSDRQSLHFAQGEEMGRFKLGSTVVLLMAENAIGFKSGLMAGDPVRMGERLATIGAS
ncbi:archaetidylserine decarboxylase [Halioxenophilus sp. WMMB6]|uniref:archaetidylserine decarboxylase n=1 Tax=Halioxenophilus sp. WMMB6 TaxID=3073815 RepID=UPI00295EBB18|nr:archaetidylserine decarboxylase [Halioxenophilus sp. WMMB6]